MAGIVPHYWMWFPFHLERAAAAFRLFEGRSEAGPRRRNAGKALGWNEITGDRSNIHDGAAHRIIVGSRIAGWLQY